jgi:hypothetical protein
MQARQAQRELKTLVDTSEPIFEQDHIALLHCANGADHEKIREAITQTQRAVDIWFDDTPRDYTTRLLIFSPDEPLGQQLIREMRSSTSVAGNTEARTHTILLTGYPSQDYFWITLRHELTHDAMLRHFDSIEQLPPFWLTEGMATVFEVPAYADGKPGINPLRLKRLKKLVELGSLEMEPLITRSADERSDSNAYATAWGLTFLLLRQNTVGMRHYLLDYQSNSHNTAQAHQQAFEAYFVTDSQENHLPNQLSRWALLQTIHGITSKH